MMEEYITADRIANAICQDTIFRGYSVLIEGKNDHKLYSKFFLKENIRLVQTFGKYKQREAYRLLTDRGFLKKIGIRDADFLRIPGNPKYEKDYREKIFATDFHDSEVMIVNSKCFSDFLSVLFNEEKILKFENQLKKKLRDVIFDLAYIIGCLKLANKRHALGLSFKPEKLDGNRLKLNKFIDFKSGVFLGEELLANTIYEYSKNRGRVVAQRIEIITKLKIIVAEKHPILEIINGHDVCEIISLLAKDAFNSDNKGLISSDSVEDMLRLAFDTQEFLKTDLGKTLRDWEQQIGIDVMR